MSRISKAAQDALLAAQSRPGSKIAGANSPTLAELEKAGLITRHDNLTVRGSIERIKIAQRREDEAFGE